MRIIDDLDADTVGRLLSSLFDKHCTVKADKVPSDPEQGMAVRGRFVDDQDNMVAVASADIPFAAFTGAAIAMLPVGGAEDAIDDKELSGPLKEAYGEVLNVLSRLFNTPGRAHCRYLDMVPDVSGAPGFEAKIKARFSVDIEGYGKGCVTFLGG